MLFGVHGMNEPLAARPGHGSDPEKYSPIVMDTIFRARNLMVANGKPQPFVQPVDYGKDSADWKIVVPWLALPNLQNGVTLLEKKVKDSRVGCPARKIALVGYSEGAWVIQKYLHEKLKTTARSVIKAVVVYGDPTWPPQKNPKTRGGMARLSSWPYPNFQKIYFQYLPTATWRSECNWYDFVCNGSDIWAGLPSDPTFRKALFDQFSACAADLKDPRKPDTKCAHYTYFSSTPGYAQYLYEQLR
jgi:hypothetical protein